MTRNNSSRRISESPPVDRNITTSSKDARTSTDKILITGGAGFIGSYLCERLVEAGRDVIVFDNLTTGSLENLSLLEGHPKFEFIEGDVLDEGSLQDALLGCSTVIHLAANRDVRLSAKDTNVDFNQNLVGTHTLLECVKENQGCRKIIFASTSTVYGEPNIIPTPESYGPLQPLSLYGASKLGGEGMISAYSHLFGIQAIICRLANVVGPRCKHGIVYDLMVRALKGENKLQVLGNGRQRKSYLYIGDCIDALLMLLQMKCDGIEVFNLGSSDSVQVKDIVSIIKRTAHIQDGDIEKYVDNGDGRGWPGDVRTMLLDCKKIKSEGWAPKYSSTEAIEVTARGLYCEERGRGSFREDSVQLLGTLRQNTN